MFKPKVMSDPTITAAILKNGHSELLKDVSIKTIQYRFQKDLCLPTLRVTVKPLLTKNIKKDKKKQEVSTLDSIRVQDCDFG